MLGTSSACGDFQSFAAAAQSKMDSASATGFSGAMRRFSTHIGSAARAGLAEVMQAQDVQEVSSAAREGYMSQLGALSEESMSATETYIDDLSKGLGALAAFRFYLLWSYTPCTLPSMTIARRVSQLTQASIAPKRNGRWKRWKCTAACTDQHTSAPMIKSTMKSSAAKVSKMKIITVKRPTAKMPTVTAVNKYTTCKYIPDFARCCCRRERCSRQRQRCHRARLCSAGRVSLCDAQRNGGTHERQFTAIIISPMLLCHMCYYFSAIINITVTLQPNQDKITTTPRSSIPQSLQLLPLTCWSNSRIPPPLCPISGLTNAMSPTSKASPAFVILAPTLILTPVTPPAAGYLSPESSCVSTLYRCRMTAR
jgi:hypothetical protein